MAPPSLLGPPELHKSSPTTTAPPPPEPESKPQGLELESPTRKASIWRRFGSTSTTPKLACNLPSFSEFGYFKDLPEIVYRLLESEDVRKKQKAEWRERKCTGRQEATGIRIRRRNRVELREEENRKKERKMESEEDDSVSEVLRDRFRLSTISIADAEVLQAAKRSGMEISESVVACISDLASKFTGLFALETWSNKQCQAFPKLERTGII